MNKYFRTAAVVAVFSFIFPLSAATASPSEMINSSSALSSSSVISVPATVNVPLTASSKKATSITSNYLNGNTKYASAHSVLKIGGKLDSSQSKRKVFIQRYDSKTKKWSTYRESTVDSTGAFSFSIPKTSTTMSLRYYLPETRSHQAHYSKRTTIYRPTKKSSVNAAYIDYNRQVPWDTNKISAWIQVGGNDSTTILLQEKRPNKAWKTVNTYPNFTGGNVRFILPKGNKSSNDVKIQYKVVVKPTKIATTTSSKTFTVQWDNPYKGSAKEKLVYNHIKHKCPNTPIVISSSLFKDEGIWGRANMGPKNLITIWSGVPNEHLKTLSLHECAHHQQWKLYADDWNGFVAKMNNVYKTEGVLGMERNAHCISHQWSKNSYWVYGTTEKICSTGETGKAARLIASGKKY